MTATVGSTRNIRVAGMCFIATGSAFLVVTMLAASIAPGYDFHGGKISDLGVVDTTALMFNALLVGIGILNAAAGGLLYGSSRRALAAVYVMAGIGSIGAGLFPLDTGSPHAIFALTAFLFFNLEALGTAAVLDGNLIRGGAALAGAVGLVYVVVMVIGDGGNPDVSARSATVERSG